MADGYDVTTITNTTYFEPGKLAAPAIEVAFVTKPSGIASSVVIPSAAFTVDEVAARVGAQATKLEQVRAL